MKTISLLIISMLLFSFGTGVLAEEAELPDPGLTPDSPFYIFEIISEEIVTFFTIGDLKKSERYARLAAERLAETQALVEKGKPELAERTLERYEMQLNNSIARAEKVIAKNEDTEKVMEVVAKVGNATSKHLEVLAEVYEKVPEEAKPAIENAIKASVKGHEKAVEALKAKNALGEIPEEVSIPDNVPQEVRERVQTRVQQELNKEKVDKAKGEVLQRFRSSESLRAFCADEGGPSEMCEKIPVQGFSFESLKDFCIETGELPEICALIEAKCKEFEITIPDECFVVLSTTGIKISPEPSLPEQDVSLPEQAVSNLGVFLRAFCIEKGGPPEACDELEGIESARAFCMKIGGGEMCDGIPIQGFESFAGLENFCIETGGTPEVCSTFESMCREQGVTIPDECFVVLSTATVSTYSEVEVSPETVPQSTLPEQEMEATEETE